MTHLASVVAAQSVACAALGSPMYADLLARLAEDVDAGGVAAEILSEYAEEPASAAVPLRLMGSVHRLVLERRAGPLATFYPSVGGTWDPVGGWAAFRDLLVSQSDVVALGLQHPPQTNEVGRSAALIGGLHHLDDALRLPIRLFEIGASAGLNLLADQFTFIDDAQTRFGSTDDELVFESAWSGRGLAPWPGLAFVERAGCDLAPVDPQSTEGRLILTSYVWADQRHRLEQLRAALSIAARHEVEVRRQSAASFVERLALKPGTVTVVWQSVMWQYLSVEEQRSIKQSLSRLGALASPTSPLVRLFFEPTGRFPAERGIVMSRWSGASGDGQARSIGTAPAHGLPSLWI